MKKRKLVLGSIAVLVAAACSLAVNASSKRFAGEPVYRPGVGFTGCYANTPLDCSVVAQSGDYYYTQGGTQKFPTAGQLLKRLQ